MGARFFCNECEKEIFELMDQTDKETTTMVIKKKCSHFVILEGGPCNHGPTDRIPWFANGVQPVVKRRVAL